MPAVATVAETSQPSPTPPTPPVSGVGGVSKPSPARVGAHAGGVSFVAQLAELEATAADANERVRAARSAMQTRRGDAAREVAADLIEYRDTIEAKKPSATPEAERPARERELTAAFCEEVKQRGLVLMPIGQGTEVMVVDPSLTAEYDAAMAESIQASRAVQNFQGENAAELEAERRRSDADKIREAIAGDDGDAIREALTGRPRTAAFTTADLPGHSRKG